jgi:hypothetical protein
MLPPPRRCCDRPAAAMQALGAASDPPFRRAVVLTVWSARGRRLTGTRIFFLAFADLVFRARLPACLVFFAASSPYLYLPCLSPASFSGSLLGYALSPAVCNANNCCRLRTCIVLQIHYPFHYPSCGGWGFGDSGGGGDRRRGGCSHVLPCVEAQGWLLLHFQHFW